MSTEPGSRRLSVPVVEGCLVHDVNCTPVAEMEQRKVVQAIRQLDHTCMHESLVSVRKSRPPSHLKLSTWTVIWTDREEQITRAGRFNDWPSEQWPGGATENGPCADTRAGLQH